MKKILLAITVLILSTQVCFALNSDKLVFSNPASIHTDAERGTSKPALSLVEALVAEATLQEDSQVLGYWPFDGNADDVSGNKNHGKERKTPVYSTAYVNSGLNLDGSYVSVDSDPFDASTFTLMAWVKPNNTSGTYRVIMEKDRWKSDWYGLYQRGNKIHFRWSSSGTTTISSIALEADVFTHVAATFDGSSVKVYINGVLKHITSGSPSVPSIDDGELRFGITAEGTEAFQGMIDEAKIYGIALSHTQILLEMKFVPPAETEIPDPDISVIAEDVTPNKTVLQEEPSLLGHWPFDGNADDVSGNKRSGKEWNSPVYLTTFIGKGLRANGAYVSVESAPFDASGFTLMAWINPDNISGTYRVIMEKDRWKSDWYGLYQRGNKIHFRWSSSGTTTTSINLEADVFTHIAATFDGSSVKIYMNGVLKHTTSGSPSIPSTDDGELRFGITAEGTEAFQGIIDEAKIYESALSQTQIQLKVDAETKEPGFRDGHHGLPVQPTGEIKLYNPPADVRNFKGADVYYSQVLAGFGISKPGINTLKSPRYNIEVKPKGALDSDYKLVFTYQSLNNLIQDKNYEWQRWARRDMTDANHWGSFDFKGEITVRVTPLIQGLEDVSISPKSKNYPYTKDNGVIIFNLSESQLDSKNLLSHKLALRFSGSDFEKHPLFIFANKFETDIPSLKAGKGKKDKNIKVFKPGNHASGTYNNSVLYFKPGLHRITGSGRLSIPSNTSVYLAGGAYLMGNFSARHANNLKFYGRGILSGINQSHNESLSWNDAPHLIRVSPGNTSKFIVKGITFTDSAMTNIEIDGTDLTANNIKVLGWRANSDGIALSDNSSIRGGFFKTYDDNVKLVGTDSRAEELVCWQQPSGGIIQLSWNVDRPLYRGYANNIDIIKSDFTENKERDLDEDRNLSNGIVILRNFTGTQGKVHDFSINNIRIEGQPYQILDLGTVDHLVPGFAGQGGSVQNLKLRNIVSEGTPRIPSYIKEEGVLGDVGPVTFENIRINGEKLIGVNHQGKVQVRVFPNAADPIFK